MEQPSNSEHYRDWEVYDKVCEKRFDKLDSKVDDVYTKVNNGLSDKVANAVKLSRWVLGVLLTLFPAVIVLILRLMILFNDHLSQVAK